MYTLASLNINWGAIVDLQEVYLRHSSWPVRVGINHLDVNARWMLWCDTVIGLERTFPELSKFRRNIHESKPVSQQLVGTRGDISYCFDRGPSIPSGSC
jgi:hypothetical protein